MAKTWTEDEIKLLEANYNKVSNDDLKKLFPFKTKEAIYKKAYTLGFRKTKENEFLNRSISHKGEKCNFWNGGKGKTTRGYNTVKMPDHHRADKNGYVLEHILIFEKATGIQIPDDCCIHHLNGIKDDNRIENLCLMTHSAHTVLHHTGAKRSEETKRKIAERKKRI